MTASGDRTFGLCSDCRYREMVRSTRGSEFVLCGYSSVDRSFPKYPRLPVLECRGYERSAVPDDPARKG